MGLIVEERTYHVFTGKLPEVVRMYTEEGSAIQQEHLGLDSQRPGQAEQLLLAAGQPERRILQPLLDGSPQAHFGQLLLRDGVLPPINSEFTSSVIEFTSETDNP